MRKSKFGLRPDFPLTEAAPAIAAIIERLLTIQSHGSRRSCLVAQAFLPVFRVRVCFKKENNTGKNACATAQPSCVPCESYDIVVPLSTKLCEGDNMPKLLLVIGLCCVTVAIASAQTDGEI